MARPQSRKKHAPECKAEPPGTVAESGGFERTWHAGFVADALRSADVPGALVRAKVGWGDYFRSRREHPAFAVACVEIDTVVKQALWVRLESQAAAGDARSVRLLNGGLAEFRAALAELIGQPAQKRNSRVEPFFQPRVRIGKVDLPQGPCACCALGLSVYRYDPETGKQSTWLVRHEIMREVPPEMVNDPEYGTDLDYGGVMYGRSPVHRRVGFLARWNPDTEEFRRAERGFIMPEPTGPSRDDIILAAMALGNYPRRGGAYPVGAETAAEKEPYYPRSEYPTGELPPESIRFLYLEGISPGGNARQWRLRLENRGRKFDPVQGEMVAPEGTRDGG